MPIKEQTRLILPTLAVSLLLLLMGGLAAWYLHQSRREFAQLLARNITRVEATEELMLIGEQLQKSLGQFLLTEDRSFLEPMPGLKRSADEWILRAEDLADSDKDRQLVEQLRIGYEQFQVNLDHSINKATPLEQSRKEVSALNDMLEQGVLLPARQYQRFNHGQLVKVTSHNKLVTSRMEFAIVLFGVSGAIVGLLTGFVVARGVQLRLLENERTMIRSEQLATLGRVAAALAHELRNPLTSLRLIAQSATEDGNHVSLDTNDFSILEQEIDRLDSSLQTFLDYARPPRSEKRTCIVQSLVRQTIALIERRATQIGVTIVDELPVEPIEIQADPGQLKQVILNILINALDASPSGGPVTVRSRVTTGANCKESSGMLADCQEVVEVEIVDAGVGLPDDLSDRIFDPFVGTKETGTGLGLAICKRIVNDHGGQLFANNRPDGGAVFTMCLPRVDQVSINDVPAAEAANSY